MTALKVYWLRMTDTGVEGESESVRRIPELARESGIDLDAAGRQYARAYEVD